MVLILHILSSLGTDGSFKQHNIENSVLSAAGRTVTLLLKPMGIDQENWPAQSDGYQHLKNHLRRIKPHRTSNRKKL